jgi:hypothetical protein
MRVFIVIMCMLTACTEPATEGPGVSSRVGTFEYSMAGRSRLDILVMVDDSTAMAPYRERAVAELAEIGAILDQLPGGTPDVNIGVTTAAGGAFRTAGSVDGDWIVDGMRDGVRTQNFTGTLGSAIATLVDVGATGTGAVQALDIMAQPLAAAGFLRDRAYLLLAIVAASDDASTIGVDAAVTSLKAMKADPLDVIVAGIVPPSAPRLDAFLSSFPNRATSTSIDADDYTPAFDLIEQLQRTVLGVPCIEFTPLDVDPDTEGPQYDCNIEDRRVVEGTVRLPQCTGSNQPCWNFVAEPINCTYGSGLAFRLDRGSTGLPYDGTVIHGECLIE